MSRFAAAGHRVFYLSHEPRPSGEPYLARRLAANLYEVSLRGPRLTAYQGVLHADACEAFGGRVDDVAARQVNRRGRGNRPGAALVARGEANRRAVGWPVVYDCMDCHVGFATNHPMVADQERELLCQARLVVASSVPLEVAARRHNGNVLLVRNACDYAHFAGVKSRPRGPRPVIGYFGAIADWFDADLSRTWRNGGRIGISLSSVRRLPGT